MEQPARDVAPHQDPAVMQGWDEVRRWRRSMRAELLIRRQAVPREDRERVRPLLGERLLAEFPELRRGCIGFYWPFKGEIDLRQVVREAVAWGAAAALPVVVEKGRPLEFWAWRPRMKMARGIWNIPVPAQRGILRPTVLLVPLLGFDSAGFRLGYGGGYYDRTLAAMHPKPLTIGVGYELGRLPTIHPQPHDVPMDAIATESGTTLLRARRPPDEADEDEVEGRASFASPPCFMHEFDRD